MAGKGPRFGGLRVIVDNLGTEGDPTDLWDPRRADPLNAVECIPGLYIGNRLGAQRQESIIGNDIQVVISCTPLKVLTHVAKKDHHVYPIDDNPYININDILDEAYTLISRELAASRNVLVHCEAGVSRSASVVLWYIMKTLNKSFDDAFALLQSSRPCVVPNHGFTEQLQEKAERDLRIVSGDAVSMDKELPVMLRAPARRGRMVSLREAASGVAPLPRPSQLARLRAGAPLASPRAGSGTPRASDTPRGAFAFDFGGSDSDGTPPSSPTGTVSGPGF